MTEIACATPVVQSLLAWVAASKSGLTPSASVTSHLDEMRLERLVLGLLDLDMEEAAQIDVLANSSTSFERSPEYFHEVLQLAIRQLRLFPLFARTRHGEYHRSVCPGTTKEPVSITRRKWRAGVPVSGRCHQSSRWLRPALSGCIAQALTQSGCAVCLVRGRRPRRCITCVTRIVSTYGFNSSPGIRAGEEKIIQPQISEFQA